MQYPWLVATIYREHPLASHQATGVLSSLLYLHCNLSTDSPLTHRKRGESVAYLYYLHSKICSKYSASAQMREGASVIYLICLLCRSPSTDCTLFFLRKRKQKSLCISDTSFWSFLVLYFEGWIPKVYTGRLLGLRSADSPPVETHF